MMNTTITKEFTNNNSLISLKAIAQQQIVFIDSQVEDYEILAAGVLPGIEVIKIDSDRDGIKQITKFLRQKPYYTVHIVSHGSPGCLYLGNSQLNLDTLDKYTEEVRSWFSNSPLLSEATVYTQADKSFDKTVLCPPSPPNLGEKELKVPQFTPKVGERPRATCGRKGTREKGHGGRGFRGQNSLSNFNFSTSHSLLIYGCNVAAGDAGEEFIAKLHQITGAEIAASTTRIGNKAKDGNWELDLITGLDRLQLAFTEDVQQNYTGVFVDIFIDDFDGNRIGGTGNWQVNPLGTDTATGDLTGQWAIGDPVPHNRTNPNIVPAQIEANSSPNALITGLSATDNNTDVDGFTTVHSPSFSLSSNGFSSINLSLNYYHAVTGGANDPLTIQLVRASDNSVLSTLLDSNPATLQTAAWTPFSTSLDSFAGETVYLRFTATDGGTASILEAGIDDVTVVSESPWEPNPYNGGILVRGAAFISCGTITDNGLDSPVLAVERVDVDANGDSVVPTSGEQLVANPLTWSHQDWTQEKIGNVYGLDIDLQGNMYATASANYGAGFGFPPDNSATAQINYGSIGGSLANGQGGNSSDPTIEAQEIAAAGTIYKMDAVTGAPTVFAVLPQQSTTVTNIAAESGDPNIVRTNTGVGLGNIHHDKVNDQFFVSNFEDGRIYRLDSSGNILDSYDPGTLDTGAAGVVSISELVYGLTVSPDGSELFFSRNRTVYSINLNPDGSFPGSVNNSTNIAGSTWNNYVGATETSHNTVPEAADLFGINLSSVVSDLDFLPTGELVVGTRVIANNTIFSSYNHGGHNYILEDTTTPGLYSNRTEIVGFSTSTQNGGDDGYGGIGYSKQLDDSYDYVFSSSDIIEEQGPHGIAVFPDDYTIQSVVNDDTPQTTADGNEIVPRGAISYGLNGDFKGVGGDVDAFNPGSIQGNVSQDTTGDGNGDTNLANITLALYDETGTNPITDVDGNPITTTTDASGNYVFDNIFPGDYTVVQTQPVGLASLSETEGGTDGDNPLGDNTVNNQISVTVSVEENDLGNDFIEAEGDYGDAPDTTAGNGAGDYTTTEANGGASHVIVSGLSIGSNIDADDGSLQNTAADADDTNGTPDDEDGISTFDILGDGTTSYSVEVDVTNTLGNAANLVGWIDFDGDGQFESSEASDIISNITASGTETLTWSNLDTLPDGITVGTTYARFRLSTDTLTANSSTGAATDGEVEDYQLSIKNSVTGTGSSELIDTDYTADPTTTGDDFIVGGAGQDTLTGGGGDDCFHFNRTSDGIDIITDFNSGDRIDLSDFFATGGELDGISNPFGTYVTATTIGTSGTLIQIDFDPLDSLPDKNLVYIDGYTTAMTATDFIF